MTDDWILVTCQMWKIFFNEFLEPTWRSSHYQYPENHYQIFQRIFRGKFTFFPQSRTCWKSDYRALFVRSVQCDVTRKHFWSTQQVNSGSSSLSWATFILVVQTSASSSQVSCFVNSFTVHMIIIMSNYINIVLISADIMKQYTLVNDSHYWISPLLLLLSNWLSNIAWSNMFSWAVIWISAINKSGSDSIFLLCASHWSSSVLICWCNGQHSHLWS